MKTFEENFPVLKGRRFSCYASFERGGFEEDPEGDWVRASDVETYCLEKQRVREALNHIDSCLPMDCSDVVISTIAESIRKARRELGL